MQTNQLSSLFCNAIIQVSKTSTNRLICDCNNFARLLDPTAINKELLNHSVYSFASISDPFICTHILIELLISSSIQYHKYFLVIQQIKLETIFQSSILQMLGFIRQIFNFTERNRCEISKLLEPCTSYDFPQCPLPF